MRKLASIQKIEDIRPIEGADKIVCATVLGWECVVKKDEFKVGDLVVYIEVDSKLPEREEFEFMRARKFRVRTIKLRGQVSQGLVLPLSVLPKDGKSIMVGTDVTKELGIIKYDPQAEKERKLMEEKANQHKNKMVRFLAKNSLFRRLFFRPTREGFPSFINKTDETRIQNIPRLIEDEQGTKFIITEKLDGQSATFFLVKGKKTLFGKQKYIFGVCSRNFNLLKEDNSSYWTIARQFNMRSVLSKLIGDKDFIAIQGEILGEGIQGNKYKVKGYDFYAFNLVVPECKIDSIKAKEILSEHGIKFVPILDTDFVLDKSIREMVEISKGKTVLDVTPKPVREGLVIRNYDKNISFKVINPDFLLKNEE